MGTYEQQTLTIERKNGVAGGSISDGDEVLLRAHTGNYISVDAGEVFAKWDLKGPWETFTVKREKGPGVVHAVDSISFVAHTGFYVSVDSNGAIFSFWGHCYSWERFVVEKVHITRGDMTVYEHYRYEISSQRIHGIDSITLTAHTGAMIAVHGSQVDASGMGTYEQQTLTIERKNGVAGGSISDGDEVLLRAHTGNYISVDAGEVFAKWDHKGDWETFIVKRERGPGVVHAGDSISLLAHTGRYVSVNHSAIFALWSHCYSWERFVVQKVATPTIAAPQAPAPTEELVPTPAPTSMPTEAPSSQVASFPGTWAAEPATCDPEINCYRLHTVTCRNSTGDEVSASDCDPEKQPPSYEPCHIVGKEDKGICLTIAPTDCVDVPGCWWNRWHKTCGELAKGGSCSGAGGGEALEGFDSGKDGEMVSRFCPVACGECVTAEVVLPKHPGTQQCEADACEDDPGFSGDAEFGVVIGASCSVIQGADCDTFKNAEQLKVACPKSCGLC